MNSDFPAMADGAQAAPDVTADLPEMVTGSRPMYGNQQATSRRAPDVDFNPYSHIHTPTFTGTVTSASTLVTSTPMNGHS